MPPCPSLKASDGPLVSAPETKREGLWAWVLYAVVIFGIGCILWIPLARSAHFIVSPMMRDFLESGTLLMTEPQYRLTLITTGMKGMAAMAALFASVLIVLPRIGWRWPVWAFLLAAVVIGVIGSAFFLPPDLVVQLIWIGCGVIAVWNAVLLHRQRRRLSSK